MPTSLPPSVREHFGEPVAEDFARWLEETLQEQTVRRDEYREVLSRLDVIEERFEQMERRFDERFDEVEERSDARFEEMEKRSDARFDEMEKRFDARLDEMEKRFNGRLEEMQKRFDGRLDQMQDQFEGHSKQVNKRFEGMDEKLDRMNDRILSMTRWLIGLIALFGTLVTALLAVAQFGG